MDLICSCGHCGMCDARGRMFEDPIPQPKQAAKTDEEQLKWEKLWNKILLDTEQLGQENRRKRDELYGTKGIY